jgi:PIN domain nuclease of toxin-antitoxin system
VEGVLVLDAVVLLALLLDEPGAAETAELLRNERCRVSTVTVTEVVDVGLRAGAPSELVDGLIEALGDQVEIVPPDVATAISAGKLRAKWFARKDSRVSLADCVVVATAGSAGRVATSDRGLFRMARGEGLEVVSLPRSRRRGGDTTR